jgi:hypothetical protein
MGYFESAGWKQDYSNLLKSLLLISKRLDEVTQELSLIRESITSDKKSAQDPYHQPGHKHDNTY